MLEFFRKYQRFFFIVVTAMIITSFSFFGTFTTFLNEEKRDDPIVGQAVDGSFFKASQIQLLARFLAADREDFSHPNLCNDGVIRYDLLKTGLADLFVASYFDPLQEELAQRLKRIRQYRSYTHPENPSLSAHQVWEKFVPLVNREREALEKEATVTPLAFTHLSRLYLQQSFCPPELLRRILIYQQKQLPELHSDPRLYYGDFSLFGFHSLSDWFGPRFIDLAAQFIWNGARIAEQQGYVVSLEEAKGDLLRNFDEVKEKAQISFGHHLRLLGFDEKSAAETWRQVLLFRRYFHSVGEAVFVDRLPYRDFASCALEKASVQLYQLPEALKLKRLEDLVDFQAYLSAIAKEEPLLSLPTSYLPLEEVEQKHPELVQATYRIQLAELSKEEVGLRASLQEVWDWQLDEKNWERLRKEFSFLPEASSRAVRFEALEAVKGEKKAKLDRWTRSLLVEQHSEWIEEALASLPLAEKTVPVSPIRSSLEHVEKSAEFFSLLTQAAGGDEGAKKVLARYSGNGKVIYRIEQVEKVADRHLLTFEEARALGVLAPLSEKFLKGTPPAQAFAALFQAIDAEEKIPHTSLDFYAAHRLAAPLRKAWSALQKNPDDPAFVKGEKTDPLLDQFKLERKECEIQRISEEEWMKEQAFAMDSGQWSPVRVAGDGNIFFFYFQEKKSSDAPILEQMVLGKEVIAADAERYLAERLLDAVKQKNAIVIPLQKDESL